jgi:hypothetical protein
MSSLDNRAAARLTPAVGLLVLAAVVVAIGIFIALLFALGIADSWVAFLFLTYWGGIDQMKFEKLPSSIAGALMGLALAYGLQTLPSLMGLSGGVLIGGAILASVYCLIMGWWPIAMNYSTMLFLTVGTIPVVQAGTAFVNLLLAFGLGVVYFAGLGWLIQVLMQRSAAKQRTAVKPDV